MQTKLATVVLSGFVLIGVAACGGSDGLSTAEEEALQERLEQAELEAAEAERLRQAEEEARKAAEEEARQAEQAEQEAADAAAEAERLRLEEEAARQAAEAERNRLEAEAEARRRADATEAARVAISGDRTIGATTTLAVGTIVHGEPVPVTTPPGPFTTTSTSRSGSWSVTSHTVNREPTRDMVQVYSDIEAPERELFSGSPLNTTAVGGPGGTTPPGVIDGEGKVVGWVNIASGTPNLIATSGSFPRDGGGPAVPFTLTDRFHSEAEFGALSWDDNGDGVLDEAEEDILEAEGVTRSKFLQYIAGSGYRDTDRFPERWAYETSGQLQGASGRYRCDSASEPGATACTVQNNGGSFTFAGDWDFIPSSGTVRIVVPDAQHMWFGWWARQTVRHADPPHTSVIWAFEASHGGTHLVSDLSGATGPATYRGPAAGRYAVYEPDTGESGIGSFTASATLQADFGDGTAVGTVAGTITGFSNDSSWSLALKPSAITGGNAGVATDGVTWTIDGIPDDSGSWEAGFYNNLPATDIDYPPHGIAGTFQAAYDPSGVGARAAVIGGFGAHR